MSLVKETKVQYSEPDKFVSSHQLTKEELDNFYKEYEKYEKQHEVSKPITESQLEGGFKPIIPNKNRVTQPRYRPGLLKTGKKPHTTPGLKNYGTRGYVNYVFPPQNKNPRINYSNYYNPKGPILFPPSPEDNVQKGSDINNLYKKQTNNLVRYAKHVVRF